MSISTTHNNRFQYTNHKGKVESFLYLPITVNATQYYLFLNPDIYYSQNIEDFKEEFIESLQETTIGTCNREYDLPAPLNNDNAVMIF